MSKDVTCSYLHSLSEIDAHAELKCLYDHKVKEYECLARKLSKQTETVSKEVYNELSQSFDNLEKYSISLELALQHCKEQMKNDKVCKETASNVFQKEREQYHEIQDLKAQLQDKNIAISELKKLIKKCKGKSVETKIDKPSAIRQPNAQRIPKPSVLGKPAPFLDSFERTSFSKTKTVPKTNVSDGVSKPATIQMLPHIVRLVVRVIYKTNVSRPQLRSTQMKDKVMPNNSQVKDKKTEVEDRSRISSISNKTESVTPCNDSLKSKTSNAIAVCATCGKCLVKSDHFACVTKLLNDVNARTKKPNVVPISTRKTKGHANKSIATPPKKIVASEATIQKSKSYYRMLYEKTISFAIDNIVQLILFIVDSGCTKHMTGNLTLLCNFVEKYLGTVHFGNDQFAPILGYRDLVQGNITVNRVYYVDGLNHDLFSVGQFCDTDLEVAFQKSTCFVRDLHGNDLLTGNRGSDLYTISLQETTSSTLLCLMAKASPTQAWLWHRRLSHLNFDYINLLSKKDVVIGLPKLKYVKDQLCSFCEVSKAKRSSFKTKVVPSSKGWLNLLHMDLCGPMRVASINGMKYILMHGVLKQDTPCIFQRRIEAARKMLSASKLPLFFWAEAIATACYTQNRSIIIPTHEKMAYHIINDRKPSIQHLHIFGFTCYLTRDGENLDKMKEKGDPCILVGYSTRSKGYRVYNKRTRLIFESIHIKFDEIKEMTETSVDNNTSCLVPQRQKTSDYDNSGPVPQLQTVSPSADATALVNKSSSPTDNYIQQDTSPTTNIHPTTEPTTLTTTVHAEENNDNQAEDAHFEPYEFINPFCTPVQELAESSLRNVDNSNMRTFYQPHQSEHRWTKDQPLSQVRGNPSKPVQTRRQLAKDPEMCIFALTVSTVEPKNIKEAMVDSAWIEAMQEVLHQFDRLQV
ncbi:retrovirus-related pol polyprotein from transposon TNT 1-94 [Tanacetum coccineum]|uniref:Retrovirus-related pol polyprotein from transposon TNT 1-94 n=1 Tax=Tanacetum coccineum TaxID=301880 RepID=A0ABQ5HX98_9ASTR